MRLKPGTAGPSLNDSFTQTVLLLLTAAHQHKITNEFPACLENTVWAVSRLVCVQLHTPHVFNMSSVQVGTHLSGMPLPLLAVGVRPALSSPFIPLSEKETRSG